MTTPGEIATSLYSVVTNNNDDNGQYEAIINVCNFIESWNGNMDDLDRHNFLRLLLCCTIAARDKDIMKRIGLSYSKLLLTTRTYFNEYYKLGQTLVLLSGIVGENGPDSLYGCKVELPFDNVFDLIPIKQSISIDTLQHIHALEQLWCFAFDYVINTSQLPLGDIGIRTLAFECTTILSAFISNLTNIRASGLTLVGTCNSFSALLDKVDISLWIQQTAAKELLNWLSFATKKLCDSLGIDSLGSDPAQTRSDLLAAGYSIMTLIIKLIKKWRGSAAHIAQIANDILKILNTEIAASNNLIFMKVSGCFQSNNNTIDINCPEFILSRYICYMVMCIDQCVTEDPSLCPSFSFLLNCIVDTETHHAVITCIQSALRNSQRNCETFLECLDTVGHNMNPNSRQVRARFAEFPNNNLQADSIFDDYRAESKNNNITISDNDEIFDTINNDIDNILKTNMVESPSLLSEMTRSAYMIIDKRNKMKLKINNSKTVNNNTDDHRDILLHFTICSCLYESILVCRQSILSNIDSKQVIIDNRRRGSLEASISECYRDALFNLKLKIANGKRNINNSLNSLAVQIHSQLWAWVSITSLSRILNFDDNYSKTNATSNSISSDTLLLDLAYEIIEETKQIARSLNPSKIISPNRVDDSIMNLIWADEGFLLWQQLLWLPCIIRLRQPNNNFIPYNKISITDLTNHEQAHAFYLLSSQLLRLYEKYSKANTNVSEFNSSGQPLSALANMVPYITEAFKMAANIIFNTNVKRDASLILFNDIFRGLTNICKFVLSILLYSYPNDIVYPLQKCQIHYPPLLDNVDSSGMVCKIENVEFQMLRIQTLSLIELWIMKEQLDIQGLGKTDDVNIVQQHQKFLRDMLPKVLDQIKSVWEAIGTHETYILSLFQSMPQESPDMEVDSMKASVDKVPDDVRCKYEYTTFLTILRSLLASINSCSQTISPGKSEMKNTIALLSSNADEHWLSLFQNPPKQFNIRIHLSKFLTISMLDHSYNNNKMLADSNEVNHKHVDYANSVGPHASHLLRQSYDQTRSEPYIVISAFARFIKCSVLINPVVAIWAFSELMDKSSLLREDEKYLAFIIASEIRELSKDRLLKTLFMSHMDETIEIVILPVLRYEYVEVSDMGCILEGFIKEAALGDEANEPSEFFQFIETKLISVIGSTFNNSPNQVSTVPNIRTIFSILKGVRINLPERMDENTQIFYDILLRPEVQAISEQDLIKGAYKDIITATSKNLGIPIHIHNNVRFIDACEFPRILVNIIWDLGSTADKKKAAFKSFKVLGALFEANAWSVSNYVESPDLIPDILSTHFLLCMSQLLQFHWSDQTQRQQEQCVRSLAEIIWLFRETDIIRFLPKIITFLDTVLASTSSRVRKAATTLTTILCRRLPQAVLSENFLSLVVGLFPIIESSSPNGKDIELAMIELKRPVGNVNLRQHTVGERSSNITNEPTIEFINNNDEDICQLPYGLQLLCNVCFAKQLGKRKDLKAKLEAIKLLKDIFLVRPVENAMHKIPYLPNIPELKEVNDMHSYALSSLSLEQTIELLCELLKHESPQVRIIALNHIRETFKRSRFYLYSTISSATVYVPDHCLSIMFQELLQLCGRESHEGVKEACAKCLGELGALDPARITNFLPPSSKAASKSSKQSDNYHAHCPWEINEQKFGFYLLESHLIPALRTSPLSQDRIGFAIQEVLKKLAGRTDRFYDEEMPAFLDDFLIRAKIKDITEPFWRTRYSLMDNERLPPIYKPFMAFHRWIGYWVRYLAKITTGPLHDYFHGCRGVFMQRHEFSQVALPHIIMDVLLFAKDDTAHNLIVTELSNVLSASALEGGEGYQIDEGNDMAVQSVFTLLDTLSSWGSKYRLKKSKLINSGWSKAGDCIQRLLDDVPKELLGKAAMRIKAYTRALRYFEISMRENYSIGKQKAPIVITEGQRNLRHPISSGLQKSLYGNRNDGSNGVLPTLASDELDYLVTIFSKLEDPDVLQGIQVLRQIQGFPSTPWNRILELQQTDDWLGALVEYGLMDEFRVTDSLTSLSTLVRTPGVENGWPTPLIQQRSINRSMIRKDTFSEPSSKKQKLDETPGVQEVTNDHHTIIRKFAEAERGRLRCLLELGHLDAIIDQIVGVVDRVPAMEQALLPLGIEAAWRLTKWDSLGDLLERYDKINIDGNKNLYNRDVDKSLNSSVSTSLSKEMSRLENATFFARLPEDEFNICLGRLMEALHARNKDSFDNTLLNARQATMSSLSAATMESYGRAYPYLTRLHILQELESGFELLQIQGTTVDECRVARENLLRQWQWNERLEMMSPSQQQRSTLLACRRSILTAANLPHLVADNWLGVSKAMLHLGRFDAASFALRNAESAGLNSAVVLLQECQILKESGQINKALMLLEPVEPDLDIIRSIQGSSNSSITFTGELANRESRLQFAERLQLATKLMVDSRQKHGKVIQDRYKCVIKLLDKDTADRRQSPCYELGRYLEYQYHEAMKSKDSAASNKQKDKTGKSATFDEANAYGFLNNAIRQYGQCLVFGAQAPTYITQALPRMLTLWFSFTSLRDNSVVDRKVQGRSTTDPTSPLRKAQTDVNEMIRSIDRKLDYSAWYTCMPQLVSRTGHSNTETLEIVTNILEKLLHRFPQQGIWHIAGLNHSFNQSRKRIGEEICRKAYQRLTNDGRFLDAHVLQDAKILFPALVDLATAQPRDPKDKKMRWNNCPSNISNLSHFLIPTQAGMLKPKIESPARNQNGAKVPIEDSSYYNSGQLHYIEKFGIEVDVASSKAKPKTLYIHTTSGQLIKFLVKQEKTGDLRKDARIMDFNTVVNHILQEDPEGRKRSLRLRTYSVICLNEECGILEWVNNTNCIRHLITDAHNYNPDQFPPVNYKDIYHPYIDLQEKDDIELMVRIYRETVSDHYRPYFHRWFIETFTDPTEWFDARSRFTKSAAVWSAVGHVVGLGDRHSENILLDVTNGECVHVDFDCLFDKGLSLARPEIVPFRLTPNLVDAMGLTGVEGTFRRTMEVVMTLLRDNKETLLGVIEPFIRDPTVAWNRSGRAQRGDTDSHGRQVTNFQDHENADAMEALLKISERLSGVYNLVHPNQEKLLKACHSRKQQNPSKGLGSLKEEGSLPLSVQGQVQRLISEATAQENLVQMYIGWQPWL